MEKQSQARKAIERPQTTDELAAMPDSPATQEMPQDVAASLATQRLFIQSSKEVGSLRTVRESSSPQREYALELPPGALLGRPGLSAERLVRSAHDLPRVAHTEGMRPAWAPLSMQARNAAPGFERHPMQRIKGQRVEPFYGVYSPDDRRVYYPNAYPWRCVGRIFTWNNWAGGGGGWTWSGSGVLVGPRHVLTAGHVCPWNAPSWAMKFVPAYWDGAPLLGAGAQSWTSDFRGWNTNDTVAAHDMAVLRLYDPIGSSLGWMGTKVYDSSWNNGNYWTLAGYPGAIAGAQRPSYQSGIAVLDSDSDGDAQELEHHGDATAGDSGGPFFGFWNGSPYAVGATSGGESITGTPFGWWNEDNNIEAGGRSMVDLVQWAHANWP